MHPWLKKGADLWKRACSERSTPRETGWSVAVGVFAGCSPFLGFHIWIALGVATLLRLNRPWAAIGSRVSSTPVYALIAYGEIEIAHHLRTGAWVPFRRDEALAHATELLGDWVLGSAIIGSALAATAGISVCLFLQRRRQAVSPAEAMSTPDESPRRTSESRPSEPRLTPP